MPCKECLDQMEAEDNTVASNNAEQFVSFLSMVNSYVFCHVILAYPAVSHDPAVSCDPDVSHDPIIQLLLLGDM